MLIKKTNYDSDMQKFEFNKYETNCVKCGSLLKYEEQYIHTHDRCPVAGAMSINAPDPGKTICNIDGCMVKVCTNKNCTLKDNHVFSL